MCFKLLEKYPLGPADYLSTPGYSWDALLRFQGVNLKLILDIEKYQFVESTIKGGIALICNGYVEANNKFLKWYDANRPPSYVIHLDANSLCGHCIMQLLPTEIF